MKRLSQFTATLLVAAIGCLPASAATLYGVTGEAASASETMYILSQANATATLALALGNGADGEAIAFNPTDGKMYHWSGNLTNIMESIDLATGAITNIPQSGTSHLEINSATWNPATGNFIIWSNTIHAFTATPGGVIALLTNPNHSNGMKGLAFANGILYGVDQSVAEMHTIDPSTGALLTTQAITTPGLTAPVSGFNGLATDPETGILWAVLRLSGGAAGSPGARHLGTLTPGGVFTSVGVLPDAIATIAFDGAIRPITLDAPYHVRYASNLVHGDSVVNITNTGANGASLYGPGFGVAAGNICVNVYAFSPDEQLISCCSCPVTPNGLVHLTANRDLVSNTLTGISPDSIVIKLVATATGSTPPPPSAGCASDLCGQTAPVNLPTFTGSTCTNSAALAGTDDYQVASGLLAWGTTLHSDAAPVNPASMMLTETQFLPAKLSRDELKSIRERCMNIIGNGSTFGICRSCRLGGLGGAKQ